MKRKAWFWFIFLFLLVSLVVVLATRYNVISIQNDHAMLEPVLGSLGFLVILAGLVFFFVRLAQEMNLSQLQSEFLAAVTHELKTPIATLELSSALLRQEPSLTPQEREKLWDSHLHELKRLREEVEMLLEAARWDAKAFRLSRVPIDLRSWLEAQTPRWRKTLGEGAEIHIEIGDQPLPILADERVLNLISDNLVDNARKFARGKPVLEIQTQADGQDWRISFRDHGWGFSTADEKKIFRRFFRSKSFAPYSIPGSGLGLYLAKSAASRMKMKLSALSLGEGAGSIFILQGRLRPFPKKENG